MGKNYGEKPRRPKKVKDDPPTEAQARDRAANALRAAQKTASRLFHSVVPRQNHHCGECFEVTDFSTCVKKGHQVLCEEHNEWYWCKGHCVKCKQAEEREAKRLRDEREEQKEREKKAKAAREDFFKLQPERKKPGTKKDKLHQPIA